MSLLDLLFNALDFMFNALGLWPTSGLSTNMSIQLEGTGLGCLKMRRCCVGPSIEFGRTRHVCMFSSFV